jgi:hypothetical protein
MDRPHRRTHQRRVVDAYNVRDHERLAQGKLRTCRGMRRALKLGSSGSGGVPNLRSYICRRTASTSSRANRTNSVPALCPRNAGAPSRRCDRAPALDNLVRRLTGASGLHSPARRRHSLFAGLSSSSNLLLSVCFGTLPMSQYFRSMWLSVCSGVHPATVDIRAIATFASGRSGISEV